MAKLVKDNIGAQSQDGLDAQAGIQYLNPNRTLMMIPLQENGPSDPDDMLLQGKATYSMDQMFKTIRPSIEVSLQTGDENNPLTDSTIEFNSIKNFEPSDIMENVPLLKKIKEKQQLIDRLELLMNEGAFQKIVRLADKKIALLGFLKSVIADIEAVETEQ